MLHPKIPIDGQRLAAPIYSATFRAAPCFPPAAPPQTPPRQPPFFASLRSLLFCFRSLRSLSLGGPLLGGQHSRLASLRSVRRRGVPFLLCSLRSPPLFVVLFGRLLCAPAFRARGRFVLRFARPTRSRPRLRSASAPASLVGPSLAPPPFGRPRFRSGRPKKYCVFFGRPRASLYPCGRVLPFLFRRRRAAWAWFLPSPAFSLVGGLRWLLLSSSAFPARSPLFPPPRRSSPSLRFPASASLSRVGGATLPAVAASPLPRCALVAPPCRACRRSPGGRGSCA